MSKDAKIPEKEALEMADEVAKAFAYLVNKYKQHPNELVTGIMSITSNFISIYSKDPEVELVSRAIQFAMTKHEKLRQDFMGHKMHLHEVKHDG